MEVERTGANADGMNEEEGQMERIDGNKAHED